MSIIMGVLQGAGEGMMATGKLLGEQALQDQRAQQTQSLAQVQSDLALQKEQALEQFKIDLANGQRQAMADRIGAAQQGIIGNALGKKYGESDAAVAAADAGQTDAPLTDEQRAVITQSKQADTDALMSDQDTYTQAAMKTGDLDPKTIATVSQRDQAAQMRLQAMQERMQTLQAMNTQTNETRSEIASLRASMSANGKVDTATGRMMITSLDADMKVAATQMKQLQDQLAFAKDKPAMQEKIDDLNTQIKEIRQQKQAFFEQMGTAPKKDADGGKPGNGNTSGFNDPGAAARLQKNANAELSPQEKVKTAANMYASIANKDTPKEDVADAMQWLMANGYNPNKQPASMTAPVQASKPMTMPALPAGAKQIGTSGGKPVYQTPDGKRFIQG
jgi:hypothetical protein